MTIVSRIRLLGLLSVAASLALARAASAADDQLSDETLQQISGVFEAAGHGLATVNSVLVQIRTAHKKLADYQDPKSPDAVLKAANAMEISFVDRLEHESLLIKKDMRIAGNLVGSTDPYRPISAVTRDLLGIDNDLKNFQDFLGRPDTIDTRNKTWARFTGALDAWSKAHPGVDSDLLASLRAMTNPEQLDEVLDSQRSIVTQVVDVLGSAK